ncbi:hypothetical protein Tco_0548890 [Tanacetum coccineum]
MEYVPSVNQQQQQHEFPQLDSGLIVLVFKQGDDPIDAINHMMSFLSAVVISRYPTTNNQLRNSSNPRQQATINDGRNSMNSLDPSPSCRPTKVEVIKELPKVSMLNTSLKKCKHHLAGFYVVVKERTTATAITAGSWGFKHTKLVLGGVKI